MASSVDLGKPVRFLVWYAVRAYRSNPDVVTTWIYMTGIGASLSALAIAASLGAPRQAKFALLSGAFGISTGWSFYESRSSTKRLRLVTQQLQVAKTGRMLAQIDNRAKAERLDDYLAGSRQIDGVLEKVQDPRLRAAYAEVAEAEYGVIPAAAMGEMVDADPTTVEVEAQEVDAMVFSPSPVQAKRRPNTPFEQYISDITTHLIAKSGGAGSLPLHMAAEARSRSGKSVQFEAFLYARLRHAIAHNYRVVPLALSAHPRLPGEQNVQWCGLPDLANVPTDELKPGFIYADPDDRPGALLDVVRLLHQQFQARKHEAKAWQAKASQDPLYLLIVDEIQDYLEAMGESQVNDLILMLNPILRGGSKFGVGFWAIGHDFVQRNQGDSHPISVGALKNMIHLVGLEELKTRSRLNGTGAKAATAAMEQREFEGLPTGLYSARGGYVVPAPIQSTKQFAISWQTDPKQLILQRLSLVNTLRQTIQAMSADVRSMADEMLLLLAEQSSNFLPSELAPHLPEIRELLLLGDAEYEGRHSAYVRSISRPDEK